MYSTVFSLGSSKASTAALDFWTKSFTSAQLLKKKEGRVDMHDGNDSYTIDLKKNGRNKQVSIEKLENKLVCVYQ